MLMSRRMRNRKCITRGMTRPAYRTFLGKLAGKDLLSIHARTLEDNINNNTNNISIIEII